MKLSVTTIATDNLPYQEISILNKKEYCEKHGYDFTFFTETFDEERPHPWGKIKAIESVMDSDEKPDWVMWVDADAFIMNDSITLEPIADNEYDLIIAVDGFTINTGVFLLRNTDNSKDFLRKSYEKKHFINHPWWEQAAMIEYLNEPNQLKVKRVNQKEINCYPSVVKNNTRSEWTRTRNETFYLNKDRLSKGIYQDGDFILHFAGFTSQSEKMKSIKEYVNE